MNRRIFLKKAAIMGFALLLNPMSLLKQKATGGLVSDPLIMLSSDCSNGGYLVPKEYHEALIEMSKRGFQGYHSPKLLVIADEASFGPIIDMQEYSQIVSVEIAMPNLARYFAEYGGPMRR